MCIVGRRNERSASRAPKTKQRVADRATCSAELRSSEDISKSCDFRRVFAELSVAVSSLFFEAPSSQSAASSRVIDQDQPTRPFEISNNPLAFGVNTNMQSSTRQGRRKLNRLKKGTRHASGRRLYSSSTTRSILSRQATLARSMASENS